MLRSKVNQLEAFHAVLQTGSATRAAELLRISQPSVSKLLQDLERGIGVQLFERTRKRLFPTPEARLLAREVEGLFLKFSQLEHVANEIRARGVGRLRVATLPALGFDLIPRVLAQFRREQPAIQAVLSLAPSQRVVEMVVSGEADIGFAYPVPGTPATIERHELGVMSAVAVLPPHHPLTAKDTLCLEDLYGQTLVSLGREDGSRDNMDSLFDKAFLDTAVAVETPFAAVACELVAAGVGIALVDPITSHFFNGSIATRSITPSFCFDFGALTSAGLPSSSSVRRLIYLVHKAISERTRGE